MTALQLIQLMFAHWVGDFVMQSRWMGNNKSGNAEAMVAHILTYGATVFLLLLLMWWGPRLDGVKLFVFVVLNMIAHLFTDVCTSNASKRLWAAGREHDFWTVIGLDQFLHFGAFICIWQLMA